MSTTDTQYTVSVTVESTAEIVVRAPSKDAAIDMARAAFDSGKAEVDDPHTAKWSGAEVEVTP